MHLPLSLLLLSVLVLKSYAQQCRLLPQKHFHTPGPFSNQPSPTARPSASLPSTAPPSSTSLPVFDYGKQNVRGVNLGGWFVLEPWITPGIFQNTNNDAIIDEYTFGQMQDYNIASSVLQSHWNTWITEDDFKAMSSAGLNHVRIPFGYWSIPLGPSDTSFSTSVTPYITGAWPYLLRSLTWARTHNIHVVLDLHGAPGSQNGYDNSGQRTGSVTWASDPSNINRTLDVIKFVVKNTGGLVDVIELLNEPAGFKGGGFTDAVRQFWMDGYTMVRESVGGAMKVMIGDAFLGVESWENFMKYPDAQGVLMDYHEYQIFSIDELSRSFDEHISFACTNLIPRLTSYVSNNIYTIVGEWSNAPTDCAMWLNGRGIGSRWEGTWYQPNPPFGDGNCSHWTGNWRGWNDDYRAFLRRYWEVQVELGERVQGWIYWTWKTEIADEWSYQKGLEGGWIPQDPSDRLYPNICS